MQVGCEQCADLYELDPEDVDGLELVCGHCGGRLLTVQQAFDRILELKREAEEYEET